jgi:tetratricopeptide (TPR) repeat protein
MTTIQNPNVTAKPVTLCLNMIVKNESRIITRLLETVTPIIDTYVICDTGSTDNTPELIKTFFDAKGIPGEVIHEPFKNFGHNRTVALKAARNKATYALLLDADMKLRIEPNFNKQALTADSYTIIQRGGSLSYYNTRFIKLSIDAKCVCPTHEYYDLQPNTRTDKLDSIWIDDIGDGGSKGDKFERDIRLLKEGLIEEPNNGRYYFYIANSYFNCNRKEECIQYYRKRIQLGGWTEEVFYSHLNLGHAYMAIGQPELAINTWMNGYDLHPARSETVYEICRYYREIGKKKLAMLFCNLGKSIPYPKNDVLFIHDDVYQYKFDYELSIIGFYNNYPNLHKISTKLFEVAPDHLCNNVLSNYKFCTPKLSAYLMNKISFSVCEPMKICGKTYEMRSSNPCLFIGPSNQYMINVRYVNYFLESNGCYKFSVDDGKIVTANKLHMLDSNFIPIGEPIVYIPDNGNQRYVGIEDVKVHYNKTANTLKFVGTCQNPSNNNLAIGYGDYDIINITGDNGSISWKPVNTQYNKGCEKNWALFEDKVVYQWYPLIIGEIKQSGESIGTAIQTIVENSEVKSEFSELEKMGDLEANISYDFRSIKEIKTPQYFHNVRGSSNGYLFNNEVWFLCHVVEYCQPREYYHLFVVLDYNTFEVKRWSDLFKIEGDKIEYSLGIVVTETQIVVSYSKWDRDATIGIFDKVKIEKELF